MKRQKTHEFKPGKTWKQRTREFIKLLPSLQEMPIEEAGKKATLLCEATQTPIVQVYAWIENELAHIPQKEGVPKTCKNFEFVSKLMSYVERGEKLDVLAFDAFFKPCEQGELKKAIIDKIAEDIEPGGGAIELECLLVEWNISEDYKIEVTQARIAYEGKEKDLTFTDEIEEAIQPFLTETFAANKNLAEYESFEAYQSRKR